MACHVQCRMDLHCVLVRTAPVPMDMESSTGLPFWKRKIKCKWMQIILGTQQVKRWSVKWQVAWATQIQISMRGPTTQIIKCCKSEQFETAKINNASHVNQTVQLHDSKFASQLVPVTRAKTSKASHRVRLFLDGFNAVVTNSTKGWRNSWRCCITKCW